MGLRCFWGWKLLSFILNVGIGIYCTRPLSDVVTHHKWPEGGNNDKNIVSTYEIGVWDRYVCIRSGWLSEVVPLEQYYRADWSRINHPVMFGSRASIFATKSAAKNGLKQENEKNAQKKAKMEKIRNSYHAKIERRKYLGWKYQILDFSTNECSCVFEQPEIVWQLSIARGSSFVENRLKRRKKTFKNISLPYL